MDYTRMRLATLKEHLNRKRERLQRVEQHARETIARLEAEIAAIEAQLPRAEEAEGSRIDNATELARRWMLGESYASLASADGRSYERIRQLVNKQLRIIKYQCNRENKPLPEWWDNERLRPRARPTKP